MNAGLNPVTLASGLTMSPSMPRNVMRLVPVSIRKPHSSLRYAQKWTSGMWHVWHASALKCRLLYGRKSWSFSASWQSSQPRIVLWRVMFTVSGGMLPRAKLWSGRLR